MRTDLLGVFTVKMKTQKVNYAKLAKQYDCDWRTAKKYHEQDPKVLATRKKREVKTLIDGLEEVIAQKYLEENATAKAIYNVLVENYGYKGSYPTIKNFCKKLKTQKKEEVTLRFETTQGFQCQIDWKENVTLVSKSGEMFTFNVFLAVLGYSRLKYIEATFDRSQKTLFRCLTNTFKYFEGVPQELLFDNMRTVVDQPRTQFGKPVFNEAFKHFAQDAGFVPRACLAYRPETKGKVESVAKLMNRLYAYNDEFETVSDIQNIVFKLLDSINNEIHSTTNEKPIERFEKEKEYLNPEPNYDILSDYFTEGSIFRKVSKDSLITYQGKRYSVPKKFIGKIVTLECTNETISIYYDNIKIQEHALSNKPINYVPEDYQEIYFDRLGENDDTRKQCERNLSYFDKLGE